MTYAEAEKQYPDMIILIWYIYNGVYSAYNQSAAILHELLGLKLRRLKDGRLSVSGALALMVKEFNARGLGYVTLTKGVPDVHFGGVYQLSRPFSYYESIATKVVSKPKSKSKTNDVVTHGVQKESNMNPIIDTGSIVQVDVGSITKVYTLVTHDDMLKLNGLPGYVDITSPLGSVLKGHKRNDIVVEYSGAAEPPFRWRVSQVSGRN